MDRRAAAMVAAGQAERARWHDAGAPHPERQRGAPARPAAAPGAVPVAPTFPVAGIPAHACVDTAEGPVRAADIAQDMRVRTPGGQWQRVRAVVTLRHRLAPGDPAPVLVRAGALGVGPATDLCLPAGQRLVVTSARALPVAGQTRVAVAAGDVLHLQDVRQLAPVEGAFVQILLDAVDAVAVEGLWLESFVPTPRSLAALGPAGQRAMLSAAPRLVHLAGQAQFVAPWPGLSAREADEVL